jgi:hypothetical protein
MRKGKEFEKIITAIESSLPSNGKIFPDYRVEDKDTGQLRQIDIAIINKDAYREIFCIIEVRDTTRRVGSPYIDQIIKKKDSVNAHKAIIVSKSGFSKPAIKKAKKYSIGTLTFNDLDEVNWFEWIRFDSINFSELIFYDIKYVNIHLDMPQEIAKSIKLITDQSELKKDDKIFIIPEESTKLSISHILLKCINQNPHIRNVMPLDGSIIPVVFPIKIYDKLNAMTTHGNFPVKSITVKVDLQLKISKSPIKAHVYRDLGENKTIAQVITATLPVSTGKKKMTVTVPGEGKIGGKPISVNIHDIVE